VVVAVPGPPKEGSASQNTLRDSSDVPNRRRPKTWQIELMLNVTRCRTKSLTRRPTAAVSPARTDPPARRQRTAVTRRASWWPPARPLRRICLLTGSRPHDIRAEQVGAFAGSLPPGAPVGTFADVRRRRSPGRRRLAAAEAVDGGPAVTCLARGAGVATGAEKTPASDDFASLWLTQLSRRRRDGRRPPRRWRAFSAARQAAPGDRDPAQSEPRLIRLRSA
jgi:hypothetical protein